MRLKGFTLIEVLITLVIIGVLVGITIVALNPGEKISTAHSIKIKSDISQLANAITLYRNTVGGYPVAAPGNNIPFNELASTDPNTEAISGDILSQVICQSLTTDSKIIAQLPVNPREKDSGDTGSDFYFNNCGDFRTGYRYAITLAGTAIGSITLEGSLTGEIIVDGPDTGTDIIPTTAITIER